MICLVANQRLIDMSCQKFKLSSTLIVLLSSKFNRILSLLTWLWINTRPGMAAMCPGYFLFSSASRYFRLCARELAALIWVSLHCLFSLLFHFSGSRTRFTNRPRAKRTGGGLGSLFLLQLTRVACQQPKDRVSNHLVASNRSCRGVVALKQEECE